MSVIAASVIAASILVAGCGGEPASDDDPVPVVGEIAAALKAADAQYDDPQRYFEVSANLIDVRLVVAEDYVDGSGEAVGYTFRDGELGPAEPVGTAEGSTFVASGVAIDEDQIFDDIASELGSALIVDLAITGGPNDAVIYDATVRSEQGGQLRVRLSGDGDVLEVMAE